ncbi:acyl-CoA dehydrogenase NM domain-like protein [Dendrothele bispora CBS 962.96]|uniref:Acyl-CoA dehydrogenase NM domain-like protein n=1 Tax=Dendrothele bispora (strain CBS 962.96) TaxID=1314807 RepID=A0A4S8KW16_DENBC|nr:acyl-CoA dehydrogenase NM domain-like protein [Dendrothele bispora CBS 962.96]THU81638.1 acyl-CoA dehydrogenase NM domain-like protein [Dendrothele bispora CBS 962.96]
MHITTALASSPLWQIRPEALSFDQRIKLSYERCKSVVQAYDLTADDITNVSQKYWDFHTDPILLMDFSVGTLLTIHYNLCAGTLAMFSSERPEIAAILDKLLKFELSGQYCLTEVGHGLDAFHLETTATLLQNGNFVLNTPVKHAAKYMPPTSPCGIPVVSIVFARLIIEEVDKGIKPFIVNLSDGYNMTTNVTSKIITPRGGSRPVKHALTYFHDLHLPPWALLGTKDKESDQRKSFFQNIYRVISGTLSMGAFGLSTMRIASYIAGCYSLRRQVIDASTQMPRPVISFSTQYIPILTGIAQTFVMEAFSKKAREYFVLAKPDIYQQHFIAAIYKVTVLKFAQRLPVVLGNRCGAQGLSEVNQLSVMHADIRGASIAEGDILTISIRFSMELLLGRITSPSSLNSDSLLFRHEASMIKELRAKLRQFGNHRHPQVERYILPLCQQLIETIGYRMAYDSAISEKVDSNIVELYVATIIKLDPAWFSENAGLSRTKQWEIESNRAETILPDLERLLHKLNIKDYVTAPIVSDHMWDMFVDSLQNVGSVEPMLHRPRSNL